MDKCCKHHIYLFVVILAGIISFVLGYYLCEKLKKQSINELTDTVVLNAAPIKSENITVKNNYVGYTEAINQVQIMPYLNGYLDKISIKPGQFVKENDLLLTIEDSEYKAKLDAADASVLQAEAAFNYHKNYYDRVQKSGAKTFSVVDIENAKNNYLQSEATLKNAYANKKLAEINYGYTKINAPISGLIGNFNLSHGNYVTPNGEALLNIVQINPIRVVFSLTDSEYLNYVAKENSFKNSVIKLTLSNGKPFKHTGQLEYTDNKINRATNSLAVYAYFENEDNELLPNAFVIVEVFKTFKDGVFIEKDLVQMDAKGYFLPIRRDGKIVILPIQILAEKDNKYILKNTFEPDDLIILDDISGIPAHANISFNILKS